MLFKILLIISIFTLSLNAMSQEKEEKRLFNIFDELSTLRLTNLQEKLNTVNLLFNRFKYQNDKISWKQKDYWTTPMEFISNGGGDCEDFAIAKYFALTALGVPQEKLRITYVKDNSIDEHMVLMYYNTLKSDPLVLDNINKTITTLSRRKDLRVVYGFNETGLWMNNTKLVETKLQKWINLLSRI